MPAGQRLYLSVLWLAGAWAVVAIIGGLLLVERPARAPAPSDHALFFEDPTGDVFSVEPNELEMVKLARWKPVTRFAFERMQERHTRERQSSYNTSILFVLLLAVGPLALVLCLRAWAAWVFAKN